MLDWFEVAKELAYMLYVTCEGDPPDNIYQVLERYEFVDEDHEWIYEDE